MTSVRRLLPLAAGVLLLASAASCHYPPGTRYVDPVFDEVTVTRDVVYRTTTDYLGRTVVGGHSAGAINAAHVLFLPPTSPAAGGVVIAGLTFGAPTAGDPPDRILAPLGYVATQPGAAVA